MRPPKGKNSEGKVRPIDSARNMPDAANSENSLEGYAAVNGLTDEDAVARKAHELFLKRQRSGEPGTADDDWFRAEEEVRRDRMSRNMA